MDVLVKFSYNDEISLNKCGSYADTIDVSGIEFRWLSWSDYCDLLKKKLRAEIGYVNEKNKTVELNMERINDFDLIDFVKKRGTEFFNSTTIKIIYKEKKSDD